ncbi:MAG TPA: YkgJ family cysteine cluster protein [Rhizomicrobium sp.]|jgi:hypothetical protein|nr:YkgJ family cysteine cluster protein [Rhizomicrobium sp.]
MSIVALSKAYPSIYGTPVLDRLDTAIFDFRYFTHCMSCGFCKDACCSYGVDIDTENMARLKALGPDFAAFVGSKPDEWFTDEYAEDAEFPGGGNGRTAVRDGACIFLDREKRGCKIHAYCLANGIDYHQLKPMVSALFPLTFSEGMLCPSGEILDNDLVCMNQGLVIYDGLRGELRHYFGDALVDEIDALRVSLGR